MNERETNRAEKLLAAAAALRDAHRLRERNRKARASGRAEIPITPDEVKALVQHARFVLRWGHSGQRPLCLQWLPEDERLQAVHAHRRTLQGQVLAKGAAAFVATLADTVATRLKNEVVAKLHHGLEGVTLPADAEVQERLRLRLLDRASDQIATLSDAALAHVLAALRDE